MKQQTSHNGEVQIDKDVPLPVRRTSGKRKYPWDKIKVGESFLLDKSIKAPTGNITWANLRFAPRHFIQRLTEEGVRVWRDR